MQSSYRIASSFLSIFLLIFSTSQLNAQDSSSTDGDVFVIAMLIILGAVILVSAFLLLSENFIKIEGKKAGMASEQGNVSMRSSFKGLFEPKAPDYTNGDPVVNLRKGHDILLNGAASLAVNHSSVTRFSLRPPDFRGLSPIPKLYVSEGDEIQAGDAIFYDKKNPSVIYVAPVSGKIDEVKRGPKRAITDVVILANKDIRYKQFDPPSITESSKEDIIDFLLQSGGWNFINERPYDVTADPSITPKNIFISTFDSAPLAPDLSFVVKGKEDVFQKGIDTLSRLTSGSVHLGLDARGSQVPSSAFTHANNCKKHWFSGKHPAGNVGIQIHHIDPINAGDKVWTLTVQEVISLGTLMYKGIYDVSRLIAITGSRVENPSYVATYKGASISELLANQLGEGKNRIIDGDVLSGITTQQDSYLSDKCDQLTVIEEGDYYEMFGWLLPIKPRPSISKTFPNFLFPNLKFDGDTNSHGEKRAFVVSGQYEQVLPMQVYPQHLMKAIMTGDFEQMEGLGIYELTEEDIAICEFACTSKMPLQSILRDGLEMMREQS